MFAYHYGVELVARDRCDCMDKSRRDLWRSLVVSPLALALLAAISLLALAPPASAAPSSVPDETWVTDGRVNSIVRSGDRIYLGGDFDQVGPNVGHGTALSAANGGREATFPKVNAQIRAAVPDGNGGWYIAGDFTRVGSFSRDRLAHVLSDGTVGSWNPRANNMVYALAISADGSRLYAGGSFTIIGGTSRNRLAAVNAASGSVDPLWNPNANNTVNALALSADGARLYVGGSFTAIDGTSRNRLAAVSAASGAVDASWDPNANNTVNAISANGTRIYVGGPFTSVGGTSRNNLAAVSATSGAVDASWNPNANGKVNVLALSADKSRLYAGGSFTSVGGTSRGRLAAIDLVSGEVDPVWKPGTANSTVQAIAVSGQRVYLGGDFTTLKGASRSRLALVDGVTGGLDANWTPTADTTVRALALSVDGSHVYVGGEFTQISGSTSYRRLARLSSVTGAPDDSWRPNPGYTIFEVEVSDKLVYAAGGGVGGNLVAFDATRPLATGEFTWRVQGDGDFQALMLRGDKVYAGGHFDDIGGQVRNKLAAVDAATGALDSGWIPSIAGSQEIGVWSITGTSGPRLYVGGDFVKVGTAAQQGFAQFTDSDVTQPEVVGVTPQDGTNGAPAATDATATFSEAMDPATIGAGAFTLTKKGATTTVPAAVSYDPATSKATLDPTADLEADASYAATIRGGANGVRDVAGNALAADVAWSFSTPDTSPPETTIDSGPTGPTNDNTPNFGFSGADGVTATADLVYSHKLDGGEWSAYSAQTSATLGGDEGIGEGTHTFYVRAKDRGSLEDPTPAERSFAVDTLAPEAPVITDPAEGNIDTTDFALSGTAEPLSTVEVFEDRTQKGTAQAEASGAWSKALSGVADGEHSYSAKATDAAGNTSATSNIRTLTVATGPPETTIDSGPSGRVNSASASFAFSSPKAGSTFECSLDGSPFGSCASPKDYAGLADGPHAFEVRAVDAAGNTDPTPARGSWSVDATAPSVQQPEQSFPSGITLSTVNIPAKLAWSATDADSGVSRYELQQSTNGGPYANVSLPTTTATSNTRFLAPGSSYQFRVRAQDGAGNWSGWEAGPQFLATAHQEGSGAISYAGPWAQESSSTAYGGGVSYTQAKGAKATFTFTGRDVAWVATKGPDRGKAEVWVDGVKAKSVDLYASTQDPRKTVFSQHWADAGEHTVEVRVLGTRNASSTGTLVDLDAIIVLSD